MIRSMHSKSLLCNKHDVAYAYNKELFADYKSLYSSSADDITAETEKTSIYRPSRSVYSRETDSKYDIPKWVYILQFIQ